MSRSTELFFDKRRGATGKELEKLLVPVTPQTFLRRYWGKEALHLTATPHRFRGFFGKEAFWRALERIESNPQSVATMRAHYDEKVRPRGVTEPFVYVTA